ncbi:hypothetical protein L7D48_01085 [Streptomyces sp. S1A]|uniref:hypothetical protein n=1 Tax=Streptomyces sp. ICN903 TaxID=2964654 RepID=UPI001ED9CD04|nr:hypothetical protein [Streptomyces sp. ICN903]MCG3039178.1 hypothetical protein [Streptomyces sp. ICN903]
MSQNSKKPRGGRPGALKANLLGGGSDTCTVARSEVNREKARWHITLGSIRAHLDEQPSRQSRRAAARRWCAAITAMGEEWTP